MRDYSNKIGWIFKHWQFRWKIFSIGIYFLRTECSVYRAVLITEKFLNLIFWLNTSSSTLFLTTRYYSLLNFCSGGSSPQYSVSTHSQAQYTGTYSPPPPEPVDFSGLPRPIGVEYLGSLGSSSYSRESTPSTGSSHFMEGYKDFNGTFLDTQKLLDNTNWKYRIEFNWSIGNSPHSSYAMFGQPDYPPNGYAGYNPSYHYSNPYLNSSGTSGYSMSVTGEYNPNTAAFGMPPPQHLPTDIKLSKDR